MRYLIHTCNQRLWYVNDYLIPSMIEQDIDESNIGVYLDKDNEGCLESCMKAFSSVPKCGHTWHMQDDVIISSDFKKRTEYDYKENIVCGFCYDNDDRKRFVGQVNAKEMWFSFPCIRISNSIAKRCANWFYNYAKTDRAYQVFIHAKKYDDSVFCSYLQDFYPNEVVLNLMPNLVDHIDYLIGGSVINKIRPEKETHAVYFKDAHLIKELDDKLRRHFKK